jgi:YVTN family beta-propeller protein
MLSSSPTVTPLAQNWRVSHTLVVFNNSLVPGNLPVPLDGVAGSASSLAYDNRSGEIYVGDFGDSISAVSDTTNEVVNLFEPFATTQYLTSIVYDYKDNEIFTQYTGSPSGTVAVISAVTDRLVATIAVGDVSEYNVNGLAYDSHLGEVFATNGLSSNVSVISTATNKVVTSINLAGRIPYAVGYDSGTHQVWVANEASGFYGGNVSVISDATNTVVKSIDVGIYPDAFAFDNKSGDVYVANGNSANVTIINGSTDAETSVGVAGSPKAMAYDPAENDVFVTCAASNDSVVSDVSKTVVATVPLPTGINGAAFDTGKDEAWVINTLGTYAGAISGTSRTLVANALLTFVSRYWAYDSAHQEEFLADQSSGQVAVVSDATDDVVAMIQIPGNPEPYRVAYDRGKGEIFTSDSAGGVGLSVINDTTYTVVKTIPLPGVEPTGMAYDPAKGEIFVGNELGSNVTIVSDTSDTIVGVIPNVGEIPWSLVYDRAKGEIFVANDGTGISGTNVTVINDTTDAVVTKVHIGTNPLGELVYDSGKGEIFVPNYGSRNVSVISDATNTVVATVTTDTFAWGAAYDPTADEIFVGNFNGAFENITVISDITDKTVGSIYPVGESASSLAFDPTTGDLYAGDSVDGTVAVIAPVSGPVRYPVTFTESGLPPTTSWSVTFNSTVNSSTTTTIGFTSIDGSYSFSVGSVPGYTASPASGPLTVSGGPASQAILFTAKPPPSYLVTFRESGLPSSTYWTVDLVLTPLSGYTSSLAVSRANGTYNFTVHNVAGYTSNVTSGTVVIAGGPKTVDIGFSAVSTPPPPGGGSSGFTGTELYLTLGLALVAVAGGLIFLFAFWRRKNPLRFVETGLPVGTHWTVILAPVTPPGSPPERMHGASTGKEVRFKVGNGWYTYQIDPVTGFKATPAAAKIEVTPDSRLVPIQFTPTTPPT